MKSKKRYVVGFWIAIAMVVILGISVVAILASFNATASSGFEISYTAGANVEATITGTYKVGSGTAQTLKKGTATSIVFATGGAQTTTDSFDKITGVKMSKDDTVIITYTIKNDSATSGLKLTASASVTTSSLTVQYSKDNSTWKTSINDSSVIPSAGLTIAKGSTQNIYIKMSVPEDKKTTGASFNGEFSFNLEVA